MTKSELVARRIKQNPHLYQREAEALVNAILDTVSAALVRGDRVELCGFGEFWVRVHAFRRSRTPRTGAPIDVQEKHVITFKAGKGVRETLRAATNR